MSLLPSDVHSVMATPKDLQTSSLILDELDNNLTLALLF